MKLIATANTIEVVEVDKIISIEACQNYSKFYLTGKQLLLSRDSLAKLESDIGINFFRIHHSYIVNIRNVRRYIRTGFVELVNGVTLPVARRRRSEFVKRLEEVVLSE